jgi:hypothetical protein
LFFQKNNSFFTMSCSISDKRKKKTWIFFSHYTEHNQGII